MTKPNPILQQQAVDEWNKQVATGAKVKRYPLMRPKGGEPTETITRSHAWLLGGHTAVVMLAGVAGGVALDSLEVVTASAEPKMVFDGAVGIMVREV